MVYNAQNMKQDNTDRMFDKRVVRRNIATGRIQSDDYDRFVSALPDLVEAIKPADEGGDNDGYEERAPEDEAEQAPEPPGDPAAGFGSPLPAAPTAAATPAPGVAPTQAPAPGVAPAQAPAQTLDTPAPGPGLGSSQGGDPPTGA